MTDPARVPAVAHRARLRRAARGRRHRPASPGATEPYEFVADVPAFDLLCGSAREREAIEAGAAVAELARAFAPEERAFARRRRPYLRHPAVG